MLCLAGKAKAKKKSFLLIVINDHSKCDAGVFASKISLACSFLFVWPIYRFIVSFINYIEVISALNQPKSSHSFYFTSAIIECPQMSRRPLFASRSWSSARVVMEGQLYLMCDDAMIRDDNFRPLLLLHATQESN